MWAETKELVKIGVLASFLIGVGLTMFYLKRPILDNLAFLFAGILIAWGIDVAREQRRRKIETRDLARALYYELANRVGRCVFDFEDPWERWVEAKNIGATDVGILRFRKFIPISPTVYPSLADRLAFIDSEAAQAIIRFYVALAVYQKDMDDVAQHCERNNLLFVSPELVSYSAERLRRTLSPGLQALRELSKSVTEYAAIDAVAIKDSDDLFKHPRSHLPLLQRLECYVKT
jgi:hypothetical protein